MSVIVKGMKMPKNCLHCDFDDSYGICACRNEAPYVCEYSAKQRPSWCPLEEVPSAQPETHEERTETHACDCISRQAAIDAIGKTSDELYENIKKGATFPQRQWFDGMAQAQSILENLPPAQPERTCVNCGRTANNGGWYADGGTRCPIEEHYALPKDGYCHLWEKRNVTDDDYPERREE